MSSSVAVAAPSLLPLVLLPSVSQPLSLGAAGAVLEENSANSFVPPSFAELVGEIIKDARTRAPSAPSARPVLSLLPADPAVPETGSAPPAPAARIPIKLRSLQAPTATADVAAVVEPGREPATKGAVEAPVMVVLPTPPALLPKTVPPPAEATVTELQAADGITEASPVIPLRIAADNTVLQVRLRTSDLPLQTTEAAPAPEDRIVVPDKRPATKPGLPAHRAPTLRPEVQVMDRVEAETSRDVTPDAGHREARRPLREAAPAEATVPAADLVLVPVVAHELTAPLVAQVERSAAADPRPSSAPAPVSASTAVHEPEPPASAPQQVRSVSLEFAPDGGRDVRLRVTDRGGEVHVSLHSNDANLTGRLREGVQDLAGALTSAGYDAETWTPRDGQQRHQAELPPEPKRNRLRSGDEGDEFAGLLGNPFLKETK